MTADWHSHITIAVIQRAGRRLYKQGHDKVKRYMYMVYTGFITRLKARGESIRAQDDGLSIMVRLPGLVCCAEMFSIQFIVR